MGLLLHQASENMTLGRATVGTDGGQVWQGPSAGDRPRPVFTNVLSTGQLVEVLSTATLDMQGLCELLRRRRKNAQGLSL